jgi:hypothetical protein
MGSDTNNFNFCQPIPGQDRKLHPDERCLKWANVFTRLTPINSH